MKHELVGSGSLRKCFTCGRWFHNEADAGAEDEECDGTIQPKKGPCVSLRLHGSEESEER